MSDHQGRRTQFAERLTGPLTPEAIYLAGAPLALSFAAFFTQLWELAIFLLVLGIYLAAFFRNPRREVPGGEGMVISPADGKVIEVSETQMPDGSTGKRVGIFLSIFDVHINRAPVAGRVVSIQRSGSAFLPAFRPEAETRNVKLAMEVETPNGQVVHVVQITGLIARRIVCHASKDVYLARGDRYGLIRFGSRTDVILPEDSDVFVKLRQKVRGGETVIGQLSKKSQ